MRAGVLLRAGALFCLAPLVVLTEPPSMSGVQIALLRETQREAQAASAQASPFVLAALDDPAFRRGLSHCCPNIAELPAPELLERYRAETRLSEMTHNFDVSLPTMAHGGGQGGKKGNNLGDLLHWSHRDKVGCVDGSGPSPISNKYSAASSTPDCIAPCV
jgi:hypothetical protein